MKIAFTSSALTGNKTCFVFVALLLTHLLPALHGEDNALSPSEAADGWKLLFNGKDLTGWKGIDAVWSVDNGAICLTNTKEGHAGSRPLIWQGGEFSDFELKYRAKVLPKDNTKTLNVWFQFRGELVSSGTNLNARFMQEAKNPLSGSLAWHRWGQKFQVVDSGDAKKPTFREVGPMGDEKEMQGVFKMYDWNDYRVIAIGNHIRLFVDEKEVCDVVDETNTGAKKGYFALNMYFASWPGVALFNNIKLKDLTASVSHTLTGAGQLKVLSEQFLNAKEWVLARLDSEVPATVSDKINALKATLASESTLNAQDNDALNCYKTGVGLCDALSATLKIREQAIQQAGGSAVRAPSIAGIEQWGRSTKIYSEQLGAAYAKFVGSLAARGAKQFITSANTPAIVFPPFVASLVVGKNAPLAVTPATPFPLPSVPVVTLPPTPTAIPPPLVTKTDPIVGRWRMGEDIIVCTADGKLHRISQNSGEDGKWTKGQFDRYLFDWSGGRLIERLFIHHDGRQLMGKNKRGVESPVAFRVPARDQ